MSTAPITAVVPAHNRLDSILRTLEIIYSCTPRPIETIVHVDGGNKRIIDAIRTQSPWARVISSPQPQGPGGARNLLIRSASANWIANFDDDSFPHDPLYFARVLELMSRFPNAAVFSAASQKNETEWPGPVKIGVFSGCGCVYNRLWFNKTKGYVPLPIAYGMEEVDLSLQIHALGGEIIHDPRLQVIHDRQPNLMPDCATHAAIIGNSALLPFLRYPCSMWPLGVVQFVRRLYASLRARWYTGFMQGILGVPALLFRNRQYRHTVPSAAVLTWTALRRAPKSIE